MAEVQDRIPVFFAESNDFEQWEHGESKDAVSLLKPAGVDTLQKWPASKRANSPRENDDDAALIEPIQI